MAFEIHKKKDHWIPKVSEENAALQIGSEEIELVAHRHLHGSFDWFSQAHSACCFSHSTPSRSTSLMEAARLMPSDCSNFEDEKTAAQCTLNFYDVLGTPG